MAAEEALPQPPFSSVHHVIGIREPGIRMCWRWRDESRIARPRASEPGRLSCPAPAQS
jgi:hypothetical protein